MKKNLLELELTNTCNARCIMCPAGDMKRKKGFMKRETFELIIKKGIDYGIQRVRFCGLGEPLLHEDFCHFFSYVREHSHYITELITNGSLLSKEIVQRLIDHKIDFLSISFPSLVRENYERIMKGLVFNQVLERVLEAIHELKKVTDTHIKITSAVTDINCDEKTHLEHFWTQEGVDCIELYTPHNRGGHLTDMGSLNLPPPLGYSANTEIKKSLCPWPLRNFFMAWDGSVFLCCCDMEGECDVGNIYSDDFSEMEKKQESICFKQPNLCQRCSYQRAKIILKKEISI
ncbi:radical SAM/SPASM domain-containing protein [candidate division CSSED10-310 bacterium]|uniref:Radical SAM/SPASM domain-containing protein n=1 Tax=candidate division CSSED10-310 bacterium TaxID=2855610 RepID=A0ABV6Z1L4_UNCC1